MSTATEESAASTHKDESVIVDHKDNLTANIFGTGDLVIELNYCKWAVHQKKFEDASDFFKRALEADRWKEGHEHYIKLHDDSPIMFARCIQFLYSGTYEYSIQRRWYGSDTVTAEVHKLDWLLHGQPLHNIPGVKESEVTEDMAKLHLIDRILDGSAKRDDERIKAAMTTNEKRGKTEKLADVKTDCTKPPAEIDLAMYQLADKYGIDSLQEYALSKFKCNLHPCVHGKEIYSTMFDALKSAYLDFDLVDSKVKEAVSLAIASNYASIYRSVGGDGDDAARIIEWLQSDNELCYMVMNRLGRGQYLQDDPCYWEEMPADCRCPESDDEDSI